MSRQDANEAFADLLPLRRQRRLHRRPLRPLPERPGLGRCRVAGVLRRPEGRRRASRRAPRRLLEEADWPIAANGELVSALDGNWAAVEKTSATRCKAKAQARRASSSPPADVQQATRDSVRALMMIRAYRMRGHLHANLDPLGIEPRTDHAELRSLAPTASPRPTATARSSSTTCSGWSSPRSARSLAILRAHLLPDARRRVHAHLRSGSRRPGSRSASKGPTRRSPSPARASARSSTSWSRPRASRSSSTSSITGTKRFGLDGGEALIPALEQIIKRGGTARREGDRRSAWPHRGRLNVLTQVMGKPHRAIFHEFKGGSCDARRRRGLGRREVPSRRLVGPRVRRQQGPPVADRQPLASRDRRSGGARQGARQAGPARRDAGRAHHGDAAADPRRRGLRRPGRGGGMLRPVGPARATAPAARSTSSSTTRSASPPIRATRAPRPIRPTWPR